VHPPFRSTLFGFGAITPGLPAFRSREPLERRKDHAPHRIAASGQGDHGRVSPELIALEKRFFRKW